MRGRAPRTRLAAALGVALVGVVGFSGYWRYASPASTCARCHEVSEAHASWTTSAHRDVRCEACHGTALGNGIHSLIEKGAMALAHYTEDEHDLRLDESQILEVSERCGGCHVAERAQWAAGGHSVTYRTLFLDERHNRTETPVNDCLRCHGMFFDGRIEALVEPLDTAGPWRMVRAEQGERPAIPCLACHAVHRTATPLGAAAGDPRESPAGIYLRREKAFLPVAELPAPRMLEGEREMATSSDPRQRLCYQCHAPEITRQAGTSDDRTPRGVHEGLSCFSCHAGHAMDARPSCALCHPALSNCGLDVTVMDTTAHSSSSGHDVHTVACADCHAAAVPSRRREEGRR